MFLFVQHVCHADTTVKPHHNAAAEVPDVQMLPLNQASLQATATRSQDEQYFSTQQALLQQQLADLRQTADKTGAANREASDGLRKNRLKLQQELEVQPWNA